MANAGTKTGVTFALSQVFLSHLSAPRRRLSARSDRPAGSQHIMPHRSQIILLVFISLAGITGGRHPQSKDDPAEVSPPPPPSPVGREDASAARVRAFAFEALSRTGAEDTAVEVAAGCSLLTVICRSVCTRIARANRGSGRLGLYRPVVSRYSIVICVISGSASITTRQVS